MDDSETEEEYLVSKHMFFEFLNTKQLKVSLGENSIESVTKVKAFIELYEKNCNLFEEWDPSL